MKILALSFLFILSSWAQASEKTVLTCSDGNDNGGYIAIEENELGEFTFVSYVTEADPWSCQSRWGCDYETVVDFDEPVTRLKLESDEIDPTLLDQYVGDGIDLQIYSDGSEYKGVLKYNSGSPSETYPLICYY